MFFCSGILIILESIMVIRYTKLSDDVWVYNISPSTAMDIMPYFHYATGYSSVMIYTIIKFCAQIATHANDENYFFLNENRDKYKEAWFQAIDVYTQWTGYAIIIGMVLGVFTIIPTTILGFFTLPLTTPIVIWKVLGACGGLYTTVDGGTAFWKCSNT